MSQEMEWSEAVVAAQSSGSGDWVTFKAGTSTTVVIASKPRKYEKDVKESPYGPARKKNVMGCDVFVLPEWTKKKVELATSKFAPLAVMVKELGPGKVFKLSRNGADGDPKWTLNVIPLRDLTAEEQAKSQAAMNNPQGLPF